MTKNGQYQVVKKLAALLGIKNVYKGASTIHGMHCFVGSKQKLGDAVGQLFGCIEFELKVLVWLDALHFVAIDCESWTPGSGAKSGYLGLGKIDTELPLLTEKL